MSGSDDLDGVYKDIDKKYADLERKYTQAIWGLVGAAVGGVIALLLLAVLAGSQG